MTPDTPNPSPNPRGHERRQYVPTVALTLLPAVVLAAVVLAATVGAIGTTVAAQQDPTVRVTDTSVEPGGSTTVQVVLTSAPDGLAGYELVLSVENRGVARITGADYTAAFGLSTEPVVSEDGRTVRLEAADIGGNVEPGATDVTLATVELRGESAGEVRLDVRPVQFDADGGAAMDVGVESGSVVVGDAEPTATSTDEPTPSPAGEPTPTDGVGSVATDATEGANGDTATPTGTPTSGQGSLPLAGIGVAVAAVALVAGRLVQRR